MKDLLVGVCSPCMKYTLCSLTIVSTLITASAFADAVVVIGANNKVNLAPVVVAEQPLPSLSVGTKANDLSLSFDGGVKATVPLASAEVKLGSVTVGPKALNVQVGNDNSVTVGPLKVGQKLPKANIGTTANDKGWFDIRLKDGIGITLPFLSLDVSYPSISLGKDAPKTK